MICNNCGKEIDNRSNVCVYCGASTNNMNNQGGYNVSNNVSNPTDSGNIGWCFLGFCVPIAGLVLFLVWKDQKPLSAKKAGLGALISVIAGVIFYIIYIVFIAAAISMSAY